MAKVDQKQISTEEFVLMVRDLPQFKELKSRIDERLKLCSWWDKYGWDNIHFLIGCLCYSLGYAIVYWQQYFLSALLIGAGHSILTAKILHLAAHGSMGESPIYNRILCWLCGDFAGCFPSEAGFDIHIKMHHPHTNIIGLGDSSTWRAPQLPAPIYLFAAPALLPAMAPIIGITFLLRQPIQLLLFIATAIFSLWAFTLPLMLIGQLSFGSALCLLMIGRALPSFSYIHINIFQHIGLPMWSDKHRPARIYQMSAGVLNLHRNPILDFAFGHSLISCHVEHHLFPRLSDSMCLMVKPIVREFLLSNNLPYNEDSYGRRLKLFMTEYSRLMVNAPPVWKYVGVQ